MKKMMLGLAATALIFASCSKDEVTSIDNPSNPNAIGFETGTGKVTKATSFTLANLEGDATGFGVYATKNGVQYIANDAYKYVTSEWKWSGTNHEWPADASGYPMNFYAYYPKAGTALTTDLTANYAIVDNVATQVDHLAAQKLNVLARPANSKVLLDFKHILSKIDFKVSAGAGMTVEVQSITVKQVGNSRTFNYGTMAWGAVPASFVSNYSYMVAPAKPANKFANATTTSAEAAAVTSDNGSMILMPQNLSGRAWAATAAPTAADSYIEVVYRVHETASPFADVVGYTTAVDHPDYVGSSAETAAYTGSLFVKVGYGLPTEWLLNKAYTYILHLGDTNYSGGNLTGNKFIDEDGDEIDLSVVDPQDPEPPKTIPDPVNEDSNIIGFSVKVSDWEPTTGYDL